MKTNYEIRYAAHPEDAKGYDTQRIRRDFLMEKVFSDNEVNMVYSMYEGVDEEYILRDLMPGDLPAAEVLDDIFRHGDAFVQDDKGSHFLSVFLGWNGSDLYIFHPFQVIEEFLQFTRIDILSSPDNHVLDASGDAVVAMFVFHAQVATVQEAVFVDDLGRGCRVVVIAFHGVVPPVAHFTLYAYRTFFARFRIDHADFGKFVVTAHRIVADFRRIVDARMRHAGRCFRQPH